MVHTYGAVQYDLAVRTHIIGILNVTPDSFSDGGLYDDVERAVSHSLQMVEDGADFIDVGGESTRPGAEPLPLEEELRRVLPVIERLAKATTVPISIDTYKSAVAERALNAGAVIVNDISGLHFDSKLADVIARHSASVILMHIKGTPKTMQKNPRYENVIEEICLYLQEGIERALSAGIKQIVVDPGIGFGKRLEDNLDILQNVKEFERFGYPVLVGPSRKSFIGKILDLPVTERVEGTAAAIAVSIANGANIVRVHDVKEMKRVATVVDAIMRHSSSIMNI
ncbi:MAG: dihydropteroate synthase [Ignavibacteriae bacterium]|nr:dihydropteroate synthase [Ignavibacteria bacterium]MBI3363291.1 dihydropteroate synthase [Ignavibacteriota bacterium]